MAKKKDTTKVNSEFRRKTALKLEKTTDAEDFDVAEHIPVLLQTIGNLKLEKIDLKSKESAEMLLEF